MQITIKTPNFDAKTAAVRAMAPKIAEYRQAATVKVAVEMQTKMQEPGEPSTSPVHWDSDRQRRKVMAMLREQGNIPYERTYKYQEGWKIEPLDNAVRFYNDTPGNQHISGGAFGLVQSNIHKGRWPLLNPVLQEGFRRLKEEHIEATKRAIHDSHV